VGSPLWVIDSSSLIFSQSSSLTRLVKTAAIEGMERLIADERLVFPAVVLKELARYLGKQNPALTWAKTQEAIACRHPTNYETLAAILSAVPEVLDAQKESGAEEADVYILALATDLIAQNNDVRIVTEESRNTGRKMCLASAAGYLGLPSLSFRTLLKFEGIANF
jgi:hypothetical protein